MSLLLYSKRVCFLSPFRRNGGRCCTIDLCHLLCNSMFGIARPFSSVGEGKICEDGQKHSFVVSYLEDSRGSSLESMESNPKCVKRVAPQWPDSVLCLLKNYGFTSKEISEIEKSFPASLSLNAKRLDSALTLLGNYGFTGNQITKVVKSYPLFLSCNAERVTLPKLEFLRSIGFSDTDLAKLVSLNPKILATSLNNHLIASYEFLKAVLGSDKIVVKSIKRNSRILLISLENNLAAKVSVLVGVGVPHSIIAKLMEYSPSTFCLTPPKFGEAVKKVRAMGFKPTKATFVWALRAVTQIKESTWNQKVEVYRKWGWSDDDFSSAFKKQPICMFLSEKKITEGMNFWVNKMGLQSSAVAKYPNVMFFNLEKRVIPRCSIIEVLLSKGVLGSRPSAISTYAFSLAITEKAFLAKYVTTYPEHVLELWNNFHKKKVAV